MSGTVTGAKELTRRAGRIVEMLDGHNQKLIAKLRRAGVYDYLNGFDEGGKLAFPPELMTPALVHRAHKHWRDGTATVYNVHPDMAREACDVEHLRVAARSMDHLPHVNPLLVFPEPVPCVHVDGVDCVLTAVYVAGMDHRTLRLCDTDAPVRTGMRLMMVTEHDDRQRIEYASIRLDTRTEWIDVEEEIDKAARRYTELDVLDGRWGYERHLRACRSKLMPTLAMLMYVTSTDMDHQPAPKRPADAKRAGRRSASRPIELVNVGWREGPEMAADRRAYEALKRGGETGGAKKVPHPRRAHYAHRWADAERTVFTHRWFRRATYVNRPELDGSPTPTIVTVTGSVPRS